MLDIVTDLEVLRQKSQPVRGKESIDIARKMLFMLERNNKKARAKKWHQAKEGHENLTRSGKIAPVRPALALGMSAIQIGIPKQVFVTFLDDRGLVFVNPRITDKSDETFMSKEGCLSLPGISCQVHRFKWVEVECDNWPARRIFGVKEGEGTFKQHLEAAAVQHEYDHICGVLISDKHVTEEEHADASHSGEVHFLPEDSVIQSGCTNPAEQTLGATTSEKVA